MIIVSNLQSSFRVCLDHGRVRTPPKPHTRGQHATQGPLKLTRRPFPRHSRPRAFTIASSHASTEVPLETVDRARSATVSPTLSYAPNHTSPVHRPLFTQNKPLLKICRPQPKRHTVASTPDLGGDQPAQVHIKVAHHPLLTADGVQSRHRKKRHVFLMGYLGEYTLDCASADAQSIRSATLSVMRRIPASLGNEASQALMALSTSRIRLLSPSDKATLCDFDVYRVHSCVRPSDSSFVSLVYVTRSGIYQRHQEHTNPKLTNMPSTTSHKPFSHLSSACLQTAGCYNAPSGHPPRGTV